MNLYDYTEKQPQTVEFVNIAGEKVTARKVEPSGLFKPDLFRTDLRRKFDDYRAAFVPQEF